MMKKALITGVTGQDGSYLAELLLQKGYEVHGLIRRSSSLNTNRIDHLYADPHRPETRFFLHYIDLTDSSALARLVAKIQPDEIYHLGAQSHVRVSFDVPEYTGNVSGLGTVRMLEAIRETGVNCRFYQASSSEMFGQATRFPQNESTPFYPKSPYGAAKVYAYWMTVNCRESYGVYACNGILFNHESPRRGEMFVTRKITRGIADLLAGKIDKIYLGNLDARRDWGYAPEYVDAMWRMLQQDVADDYVIATGESHSVRDFVAEAFRLVGISDWERQVGVDPRYFRPTDVAHLQGDASKARRKLGWEPTVRFPELVRIMLEADLKAAGLAGKLVSEAPNPKSQIPNKSQIPIPKL